MDRLFGLMEVTCVVECSFGYIVDPFLLGFHRRKLYFFSDICGMVLAGIRRDLHHSLCLTLPFFSFVKMCSVDSRRILFLFSGMFVFVFLCDYLIRCSCSFNNFLISK